MFQENHFTTLPFGGTVPSKTACRFEDWGLLFYGYALNNDGGKNQKCSHTPKPTWSGTPGISGKAAFARRFSINNSNRGKHHQFVSLLNSTKI
jgi:hypothetical protein